MVCPKFVPKSLLDISSEHNFEFLLLCIPLCLRNCSGTSECRSLLLLLRAGTKHSPLPLWVSLPVQTEPTGIPEQGFYFSNIHKLRS